MSTSASCPRTKSYKVQDRKRGVCTLAHIETQVRDIHARRGVLHLRVHGKGGKVRYLPLHPGTAELVADRQVFDCEAEIVVSGQCPPQLGGAVLSDLAQLDQEIDILLSQARR